MRATFCEEWTNVNWQSLWSGRLRTDESSAVFPEVYSFNYLHDETSGSFKRLLKSFFSRKQWRPVLLVDPHAQSISGLITSLKELQVLWIVDIASAVFSNNFHNLNYVFILGQYFLHATIPGDGTLGALNSLMILTYYVGMFQRKTQFIHVFYRRRCHAA